MFGLGILWAGFAPLLILLLIWPVSRLFKRSGVSRHRLAATAAVLLPIGTIYALDRMQFASACVSKDPTGIFKTAKVDGFVLTSQTANSFGTTYLYNDGFKYFEALDYKQGYRGWARYELGPDRVVQSPKVEGPSARYEVRESFEHLPKTISFTTITVLDRETGEVLARARDGRFGGGTMSLLLGAWGSANCASRLTGEGSRAFRSFNQIVRNTLGGGAPNGP